MIIRIETAKNYAPAGTLKKLEPAFGRSLSARKSDGKRHQNARKGDIVEMATSTSQSLKQQVPGLRQIDRFRIIEKFAQRVNETLRFQRPAFDLGRFADFF